MQKTRCLQRLAQQILAMVVATILMGAGLLAIQAPMARADREKPYPELRYFTRIDSDPYMLPGQGLWFRTPLGLNCGIWWRGSFGCAGDIPGAPDGVHHIGWITGDTRVHYDWTMPIRFPSSQGQIELAPLTYVESEGTTCATTVDGSTYCERGPWRLLITPTHTWLNG